MRMGLYIGLLLLVLQQAHSETLRVFRGKLVVFNKPRRGQQLVGGLSYQFRKQGEFTLYTMFFGPSAAQPADVVKTGDIVNLVADLDLSGPLPESAAAGATPAGAPGTLYVTDWFVTTGGVGLPGPSRVYYTGEGRLALRTVVWVVSSVCGEQVQGGMTVQDVADVFFGPPPGAALQSPPPARALSPSITLNRLWDQCSYGNVQMRRSDVTILDLSLPCSGVRSNGAVWNVARGSPKPSCALNDIQGWMEYAVAQAQQQGVLNDTWPLRRVLLVPPPGSLPAGSKALCSSWQQRGSFGCDGDFGCDIWIRAERGALLERLMTQMGSSMVLSHSTTNAASTTLANDPSSPMGDSTSGNFKCFDGPNSFKLLFSSAINTTDQNSTWPAVVHLPAAANDPVNQLLVVPNWVSTLTTPAPYILYGQFRPAVAGDWGLPSTVRNRIVVHGVAGTGPPAGSFPGPSPVLLARLSVGETYRYDPAGVLIKFESLTLPPAADLGGVTGGAATVIVCRYDAAVETDFCFDGVDNDCDGLVDDQDPDCFDAYGRHHH